MTDRHETRRAFGRRAVLPLMASALLLACEAHVGSGPSAPYQSEDSTGERRSESKQDAAGSDAGGASSKTPNKAIPTKTASSNNTMTNQNNQSDAGQAPSSMCADAPHAAQQALTTYCSGCHGNTPNAKAGFNTILNAPALLTSGKVVANDPEMSLVYKRIKNGSMPPAEIMTRPDNAAISAVEVWIKCGAQDWDSASSAPSEFVEIDQRLRWVLDDLRALPNPVDRERMRYIDISSLSNGGASQEDLTIYREAASMLMNSLSRGRSVVAPKAIDQAKLIYRIDLRDYLWDATSWNQLEQIYPYAVIYDQNSRLFPYDEVTAEQIRLETNTQIPLIQADWFISHASRPPLYYSLLNLPDTLQGLEQQLGVDIQRNIDTEQVLRSGFANAGPSQNNRVIERHELGGNRGALWLSYDFSDNLNNKNIFSHPLDFQEDGGEMIFNLDNGLQGYFIANAAGRRLDKAPNNVVQDPASRDGAVESGLSCMNCHQVDGQLPKFDEIRDFVLNAGASAAEIEKVLALYVPKDEMQAAFDADQNRYKNARAALSIKKMTNTTMHQLDDRHLGIIDINGVAAVIGLRSDELLRAIDASPQAFPPEIVTLRTRGGGIQRDSFESIVDELITALGLGKQLRANGNRGNAGNQGNQANQGRGSGNAGQGAAGAQAPAPTQPAQPAQPEADAGVASDAGTAGSDRRQTDGRRTR